MRIVAQPANGNVTFPHLLWVLSACGMVFGPISFVVSSGRDVSRWCRVEHYQRDLSDMPS
jgi:hypothetical protein